MQCCIFYCIIERDENYLVNRITDLPFVSTKIGLFALRDFVKGEVVTEYGGRILSLEDTEGKDSSYFRVIGLSKENGVIDGIL